MKYFAVLVAMMWGVNANAAVPYGDKMISMIAKKTKWTKAEVVEALTTGCDSGHTQGMLACGEAHSAASDIKLNIAYQKLVREIKNKPGRNKLAKAQRAWLAFRDTSCAFVANGLEGTGHAFTVSSCESEMADQRTKVLKEYGRCEEIDCYSDEGD